MSSFKLSIVTPDGLAFEGEAEKLVVRTSEGDTGILKNHINYVAALGIGPLRVFHDGASRLAAASGGFVEVSKEGAVVLAKTFEWAEDIDLSRAEGAKARAQERLNADLAKHEQMRAEVALKKAVNRIRIGQK